MLAFFNFRKDSRLFTLFFETAESSFETFVIAQFYLCQKNSPAFRFVASVSDVRFLCGNSRLRTILIERGDLPKA
jgi:hypothetical protein